MKTKYHDVTKNEDGVFSTLSGKLIDIENPTADMISLQDIATGLSNVCRFGGQISDFYSVAQHSVLVSHVCPPEFAIYGLMHDASEAYIGDVIKPLKNLLGAVYEDIEAKFMHAICDKFRLRFDLLKEVKEADLKMLKYEHDKLRGIVDVGGFYSISDACFYEPRVWAAEEAREFFIERFVELI